MTTDYKPMPPEPKQEIQDKYVGAVWALPVGDMTVNVRVLKVRNRFGNVDAHIIPMQGSGSQWVKADRLTETAF